MASSELFVSLILQLKESASPELKKVGAELEGLRKKADAKSNGALFSGIRDGASQVNQALATIGIGASVAGVALFVKNSINHLDTLRDAAIKTDIDIGTLAGLESFAKKSGSDLQSLLGTIRFVSRATTEAAMGSEEATRAFANLGITWDELERKDPIERFYAIIDGLNAMTSPTLRNVTAQALLGRSYQDLLVIIKAGTPEIRDAIDAHKEMHPELGKEAEAADKANDALVDLNDQMLKLVNTETIESFKDLATAAVFAISKTAQFGNWLGGGAQKFLETMAAAGAAQLDDGSGVDAQQNFKEIERGLNTELSLLDAIAESARKRNLERKAVPANIVDDAREFLAGEERVASLKKERAARDAEEAAKERRRQHEQDLEDGREFIRREREQQLQGTIAGIEENRGIEIAYWQEKLAGTKELAMAIEAINIAHDQAIQEERDKSAKEEFNANQKALKDIEERGKKEIEITRDISEARRQATVADATRAARSFDARVRLTVDGGDMSRADSMRQRSRLQQDIYAAEKAALEDNLSKLVETRDTEAERERINSQIKDVMAAQGDEAARLAAELRQIEGTFQEGFGQGIREFREDLGGEFSTGMNVARDSIDGVSRGLRGLLSDLQSGNWQGALGNFANTMIEAFNEIIAKMIAMKIIGASLGLFGGGAFSFAELGAAGISAGGSSGATAPTGPFGLPLNNSAPVARPSTQILQVTNNIKAFDSRDVYESLGTKGGQQAMREHALAASRKYEARRSG